MRRTTQALWLLALAVVGVQALALATQYFQPWLDGDTITMNKADGSTFTIVPHGAIHTELAAGTHSALRIVSPSISRTVSLACALTRSDSQACNAIARLMLDLARGLVRTNVWQGRADFGPQDTPDA